MKLSKMLIGMFVVALALSVNAGYFYMWHSHNEKEMVNYDIFPGGMMTMLIIEPHGVIIE
jgi:hypothetical protein